MANARVRRKELNKEIAEFVSMPFRDKGTVGIFTIYRIVILEKLIALKKKYPEVWK